MAGPAASSARCSSSSAISPPRLRWLEVAPMKLSDIQKVVQKAVEPPAPPPITVVPAPAPRPARSAAAKRAGPTLSRVGKIHLSTYVHPDFKRSLRLIQAQTRREPGATARTRSQRSIPRAQRACDRQRLIA